MGARAAQASYNKAADYGFGASIAGNNALAAKASRPSGLALGATIAGHVGSGFTSAGSLALSGGNFFKTSDEGCTATAKK